MKETILNFIKEQRVAIFVFVLFTITIHLVVSHTRKEAYSIGYTQGREHMFNEIFDNLYYYKVQGGESLIERSDASKGYVQYISIENKNIISGIKYTK